MDTKKNTLRNIIIFIVFLFIFIFTIFVLIKNDKTPEPTVIETEEIKESENKETEESEEEKETEETVSETENEEEIKVETNEEGNYIFPDISEKDTNTVLSIMNQMDENVVINYTEDQDKPDYFITEIDKEPGDEIKPDDTINITININPSYNDEKQDLLFNYIVMPDFTMFYNTVEKKYQPRSFIDFIYSSSGSKTELQRLQESCDSNKYAFRNFYVVNVYKDDQIAKDYFKKNPEFYSFITKETIIGQNIPAGSTIKASETDLIFYIYIDEIKPDKSTNYEPAAEIKYYEGKFFEGLRLAEDNEELDLYEQSAKELDASGYIYKVIEKER